MDHWTAQPTSDLEAGDIKWLWEPSRFGFVWALCRAWAASSDDRFVEALWRGVESWVQANPPFDGPNWYCGQEAALRSCALLFARCVLANHPATTDARRQLVDQLLYDSARRVELTLDHALSIRNNHTTSELIGLWVAGVVGDTWSEAPRFRALAEKQLPIALADQVARDGAYIQDSFNYQRLFVHSLLFMKWVGRHFGAEVPAAVDEALRRSLRFMKHFVLPETGELPNYGSNDGALILPLSSCAYRDMRPVLQHLSAVVTGQPLFAPGPWDEERCWFGVEATGEPEQEMESGLSITSSGYVSSKTGGTSLFMTAGARRHRPSHADALHVDFAVGGRTVLLDPGTFAYTAAAPWGNGLSGTRVHNTASVDEEDQLRRLGRFMWSHWHDARVVWHGRMGAHHVALAKTAAKYDGTVTHERLFIHGPQRLIVLDELAGESVHEMRVHWNLRGTNWLRHGDHWRDGELAIRLQGPPGAIAAAHVGGESSVLGWYSSTYGERTPCTAIELWVRATRAHFATVFCWGDGDLAIPQDAWQAFIDGGRRRVAYLLARET